MHGRKKSSIFLKIIIPLITIIILGVLSLYSYIHSSFEKWCEEQNVCVSVQSYNFNWRSLGLPSICLKEVNVKNKNPKESFVYMKAHLIDVQPFLFSFMCSYGRQFEVTLEAKDFEIELPKGDIIAAQKITGEIVYAKDLYIINSVTLEPLSINLPSESTQPTDKGEIHGGGAQLILYQIKGNATYHVSKKDLELSLEIPPASASMPAHKLYGVKARGELHFLDAHKILKKDDLGVRGHVTCTFQNFSNFLRHLQKSRLISTIAMNVSEIVGHALGYDDILTNEKEFFPNALSLDLSFREKGMYVGPFKL